MKILVTFALETEFAPWRRLRSFGRAGADAPDMVYQANAGDADVRVVLTGVGGLAGRRLLSRAMDEGPDVCISSGLAGALKPEHPVGKVLVARGVCDAQGRSRLRCDDKLVAVAEGAGARPVNTFVVSDHVAGRAEEKRRLAALGDAVEMESSNVLSGAAKNGIPAVSVRAISDAADSDLPLDFDDLFGEDGNVKILKVAGQLAAHPGRIAGTLRLAQDSERAAGALAQFLDAYVQVLSSRPFPERAKANALAL